MGRCAPWGATLGEAVVWQAAATDRDGYVSVRGQLLMPSSCDRVIVCVGLGCVLSLPFQILKDRIIQLPNHSLLRIPRHLRLDTAATAAAAASPPPPPPPPPSRHHRHRRRYPRRHPRCPRRLPRGCSVSSDVLDCLATTLAGSESSVVFMSYTYVESRAMDTTTQPRTAPLLTL